MKRLSLSYATVIVGLFFATRLRADTVAYWRHEEGTAGAVILPGFDTVLDSSGNFNNMRTFDPVFTSADYTPIVSPLALRSGLLNELALNFGPGGVDEDRDRAGFDDDNYTEGKPIQTHVFPAMTVELAFNMGSVALGDDKFQALIGKDGGPLLPASPIPPFKIVVRGDSDPGGIIPNQLSVEWIDGDGDIHLLASGRSMEVGEWNHVAFTLTATTAELWIADETGPYTRLASKTDEDFSGGDSRVLIQDPTPWTIGRGAFDNRIVDWSDAIIDEVRISDSALAPAQFLFVADAEPVSDADFDNDLDVDGHDFLILQRNVGAMGTGTPATGDANRDTNVNAADLAIFKSEFGTPQGAAAVPEPSSILLAALAFLAFRRKE